MNNRFDPKKIERLNRPTRLEMIPPAYIWNILNPQEHNIKVEIGAGAGLFCKAFQQLSGIGETYALDVSGTMIDWMTENVVPDHPDIIPVQTDGSILPLNDDFADIVFMITVHHELDDKIGMLKEARRILRPDGKIFIVDWNKDDPDFGPPVEIRNTGEEVAEQMRSAGFRNVESDGGITNFLFVIAVK